MKDTTRDRAAQCYGISQAQLVSLSGGHVSHVYSFSKENQAYVLRITPPNDEINFKAMRAILTWMQFLADIFDPAFIRLNEVDAIRSPLLGPLAIEDSGRAGRIVREGFDDPDDLIDGVTYVKAAEVIRMLLLTLGPEQFRAGKVTLPTGN